jgi:hypothetical protein
VTASDVRCRSGKASAEKYLAVGCKPLVAGAGVPCSGDGISSTDCCIAQSRRAASHPR